jgi:hypothetical protein
MWEAGLIPLPGAGGTAAAGGAAHGPHPRRRHRRRRFWAPGFLDAAWPVWPVAGAAVLVGAVTHQGGAKHAWHAQLDEGLPAHEQGPVQLLLCWPHKGHQGYAQMATPALLHGQCVTSGLLLAATACPP